MFILIWALLSFLTLIRVFVVVLSVRQSLRTVPFFGRLISSPFKFTFEITSEISELWDPSIDEDDEEIEILILTELEEACSKDVLDVSLIAEFDSALLSELERSASSADSFDNVVADKSLVVVVWLSFSAELACPDENIPTIKKPAITVAMAGRVNFFRVSASRRLVVLV